MAITSGFFNAKVDSSGNYDRAGTAEQFAKYFSQFIGNGIFMNSSERLQVLASSGMNLLVKAGYAWINGYWLNVDTDTSLSLSASPTSGSRIDRVVLRLDLTQSVRAISLEVKSGTASVNPAAPDLTRNNEIYELAIADIVVEQNVAAVVQSNITDTRLNTNLCGIVTSLVDQVDTQTLYDQIQADLGEFKDVNEAAFTAWIASIQGILDEDMAGHLLTLIGDLKTEVENTPWQTLAISSGAAALNTENGTRFKLSPNGNVTVTITCNDGDAFALWLVNDSDNITFVSSDQATVEVVGELEHDGDERVISFIRTGSTIRAYVLGKD